MFLIPSRFPTPSLACSFFSLRATVTSSSKLSCDHTSNPTSSTNPTPKGRTRRSYKQKVENSNFEEYLPPVATMIDNRTMAEMIRAPTEGYAEASVVPPILAEQFELKHSLINMMTSEQFFILEKDSPHDHIRWAACRWLEKEPPHSITTWDDLVSNSSMNSFPPHELRTSAWERYKDLLRACPHHGFTELHQLDTFYNALNPADQDYLNATACGNLLEKSPQDALTIIENKSKVRNSRSKPIASPVKAVEEICVTCGGAHPYYNVLPLVATLSQNSGIISKVTFQQPQATTIRSFVDEHRFYFRVRISSGNTVANSKGKLKAITTCNGLVSDGPTIPTPPKSVTPEDDERVEEIYTNPDLAEYTIKVPPPPIQKCKPPYQRNFVVHTRDSPLSNIPYPSRILKQKQQEIDEIQIQKFWHMFKQLHLNITLVEALVLMPKYQKMLKALLPNKEKLQELANTPLNENCSAVILKKLPEKLRDPGKFLILCGFSELKCKALVDLGASINLMPLSVWKNLEYDSFNSQDFSRNDDLPSPDNEDKVKEKQEKDNIGSKPDKKREVWRSLEKSKPITVMLKYRVIHRLSTAYHPQTSGQVEVSNRGLKRILERTIGENRASWSDKLDDALWAFRTAHKTPIGCTPYKLVYGKACHLLIELEHKAYSALKQANFDLKTAGDHRKVQINELNELRDQAYENSLIYKEKSKRLHDSKIKNHVFNIGDRVLLFNSQIKIFSSKLKSRWSGPFTISQVFPYGTIELT
uniref:Reverse transcriptase domain-containing protein n=1 Tax=Tanacetum cinerariifolium TaxID=118510 RepID=A0A6L2L195_TANCI|nr:reverse transcriptase domain-containing protein [Tanacetum cinerariifolium]